MNILKRYCFNELDKKDPFVFFLNDMSCCELSIDALQQPSKCTHVLVCNGDMSDLCKHSNDNDGKEKENCQM